MHTKRIARGAKWLDKECPGWFEKVDTDDLFLTNQDCVIGQVYGDFTSYMCRRYFVTNSLDKFMERSKFYLLALLLPNIQAGFLFMHRNGFGAIRETDDQWRAAWTEEINKRKLAKTPSYVPIEWEAMSEV